MDKDMVELAKELEQRDYNEKESAIEVAENTEKLLTDSSSFDVPGFGKIKIVTPNFQIQSQLERFRAEKKYEVMKLNPLLPTKKQLFKLLEERGEWDPKKKTEAEELALEIENLESEYKDLTSPTKKPSITKKKKALKEILKRKQALDEINREYMSHSSQTVEGFVGNLVNFYSLYLCVQKPDGSSVWPTFGDMMTSLDEGQLTQIFSHAAKHWEVVRDDFLDSLPEEEIGE